MLRFFEDRTQSEIGATIGVSQMQISRILRRAIARLTELTQLENKDDELSASLSAERWAPDA